MLFRIYEKRRVLRVRRYTRRRLGNNEFPMIPITIVQRSHHAYLRGLETDWFSR